MKLSLSSLVPHFNTFIYILIVWFYSFGNSMTVQCYRITPDVYNRTLTRSVSSLIISIAVLYYQISMIPVPVSISMSIVYWRYLFWYLSVFFVISNWQFFSQYCFKFLWWPQLWPLQFKQSFLSSQKETW